MLPSKTHVYDILRTDAIRVLAMLGLAAAAVFSQSFVVLAILCTVVIVLAIDMINIRRATETLRAIAEGDRFIAFPAPAVAGRHCRLIAAAGERMRRDLIEADAAIADQHRLLEEARIRRDSAAFFTSRFHGSVAQAFASFARRGDEICATVDNLNTHNTGLLRDARSLSAAVSATSQDVQEVSRAATRIADIVAATSDQIAGSDAKTQATLADLRRARETIERLKRSGQEISTISSVIRSVASQTSLLALNATIEAARAGEQGRGFAVVASEVKTLAKRSEQATATIHRQIEDIQTAVDETSNAIENIVSRVDALTATHNDFATSLMESTMAIETVGTNADTMAGHVSHAMPDLVSGVGEIETAGRSVLDNARELMSGSERLVTSFQTYFDDLASGSIKVGILHSLSGTVTAAERPLHTLLIGLIDETNRNGGLLGRPLEAMMVNPRSDAKAYAAGARQLIEGGAAAIFGCWTSQSRIETIPVLEAAEALLFYPSQYEGGESSRSVIYTGGTPQQQAWPAVDFLVGKGRRRLVLLGHDTAYSCGTHDLIRRYAPTAGAMVALDLRMPLNANWARVVSTIAKLESHEDLAIVSTLSGDASVSFFRALAGRLIGAARLPVLALSIGEAELPSFNAPSLAGHYVAWNYLHSIAAPENEAFVALWRRISDNPKALANDALAATYVGFTLWSMAVRKAGSTNPNDVRGALGGLSFVAPCGYRLDVTRDRHTTLPAVVGQILADGSIRPVWASRGTRAPDGSQRLIAAAA